MKHTKETKEQAIGILIGAVVVWGMLVYYLVK